MEIRRILLLLVTIAFASSCAQLTPFHSARTEGAGNLTLSPTIDATAVASSASNALGSQVLPGARVELAYGLIERMDALVSINSAGAFKGSVKLQILGDNYANVALAVIPGYEYQANIYNQGNNENIQRIHLPIVLSVSGGEYLDTYIGPDFVMQFEDNEENTLFSGLNIGIELGRRVRYNIGFGGYIPYQKNSGVVNSVYQFGVGARIPLIKN